jgi:hypothetical protein
MERTALVLVLLQDPHGSKPFRPMRVLPYITIGPYVFDVIFNMVQTLVLQLML